MCNIDHVTWVKDSRYWDGHNFDYMDYQFRYTGDPDLQMDPMFSNGFLNTLLWDWYKDTFHIGGFIPANVTSLDRNVRWHDRPWMYPT